MRRPLLKLESLNRKLLVLIGSAKPSRRSMTTTFVLCVRRTSSSSSSRLELPCRTICDTRKLRKSYH